MEKELVSIIIPVYNTEKYIEETINTVKEQTYNNWELILVDDCSTDKSTEIITKHLNEKIKLIQLTKKSGTAISRNTGIEVAKGRYIAFLDADDLWKKDKLKKQITFMDEKKCAFSFTGYEYTDESGLLKGKTVKVPTEIKYKDALKNTTISTITVMFDIFKINKELIEMPDVKSEDSATWWKILRNGYTAYGINESLSYYRRHGKTSSSNKLKSAKNTWYLYRKCEGFNAFKSLYYFIFYIFNAIKRRI